MLLDEKKKTETFNIVQAEFEGYKRWGFAAGYTIPSKHKKPDPRKLKEALSTIENTSPEVTIKTEDKNEELISSVNPR